MARPFIVAFMLTVLMFRLAFSARLPYRSAPRPHGRNTLQLPHRIHIQRPPHPHRTSRPPRRTSRSDRRARSGPSTGTRVITSLVARRHRLRLPVAGHAQGDRRRARQAPGVRRARSSTSSTTRSKSIYHGAQSAWVAPIALTTFCAGAGPERDGLPAGRHHGEGHAHASRPHWRIVPTADVNTTFALALSVFFLMIVYGDQRQGPRRLDPRAVLPAVRQRSRCCGRSNLLFNIVEYISKPLSHSLRLFGNIYAGEIIFLLLGLWAATGLVGTVFGGVLNLGWAIFHILIVVAAGLHLHDAHHRLPVDGRGASLTARSATITFNRPLTTRNERKQRWTRCNCWR